MKKGIRWSLTDTCIRNFQRLLKRFLQNDGFTLIELLMVVIILGILAAVVIPQFSGSAEDAKISALKSNLSSIRSAVELYQVQHSSKYPDPNIIIQLTRYTDPNGIPNQTKTTVYKYGPYLKQGFPKNPFAQNSDKAAQIYIDSTTATIGTIRANPTGSVAEGWVYASKTGEFIANTGGYDQY